MFSDISFLHSIIDAIPSMLFVVDEDVRILCVNAAAVRSFGMESARVLHRRAGEALRCLRSEDVPEGCGRGPACGDCVIRESVRTALQGSTVSRRHARMELRGEDAIREVHVLVTASAFSHGGRPHVLLTLEDINELLQLKSLVPICAACKKVRNAEGSWKEVSDYFGAHLDIEFSHGLCKECARKLYPGVKDRWGEY